MSEPPDTANPVRIKRKVSIGMRTLLLTLALAPIVLAQTRDEVLAAMRRATEFYRNQVAKEGGYHYYYAADLSYGRSEHADGLSMVENQREATPIAGMTYLDAWEVTGD